jgi:hypothetical protein
MIQQSWPATGRRDYILLAGLFAISRALYGLLGLRFDSSTLPGYMQFIDPALLRDRLLESLWYYHAHPPLLNLFTGIATPTSTSRSFSMRSDWQWRWRFTS